MDNPNSERAKRGIESIAHLFLSQLGNNSSNKPGRTPPAKVNPVSASNNETGSDTPATGPKNDSAEKAAPNPLPEPVIGPEMLSRDNDLDDDPDKDLENSLAGEIVLAYHLRDSYQKVKDYVRYLSSRDEKIALVSIDQYEVSLIIPTGRDSIDSCQVIAETEGKIESLIPEINDATDDFDLTILNIDPSFAGRIGEIISFADCVTIISDATNDGIIRAYQILKSVADLIQEDQEIQLFICDADSSEQADRAYYKFNETARKFINMVILPAGFTLRGNPEESRPADDLGISDQEIIELNLAESGISPEAETSPQPESQPEEKPLLNCEHYINSHDRSEISEIFVRTEDTFIPDSYENICDDQVVYVNNDMSRETLNAGPEETPMAVVENENKPEPITGPIATNNVRYKPAKSLSADQIANGKREQISSESEARLDFTRFRSNIISTPSIRIAAGPARIKPVKTKSSLTDNLNICDFVCLHLAELTEINGCVATELKQFTEQFGNSRILIDQSGHIKVLISAVYSGNISDEIDSICSWLSDNTGALATRYRHLHIKSQVKPELFIVAGDNYAGIYDEALLATDELDLTCRIWQLTQFELAGEMFISLR